MKTNAKEKLNHHIKSAHHVVKKTHELFKKSKTCNYTNALLLTLLLSIAILAAQIFFNNNKTVPEAEIRFTELSKDNKITGTVMPASCQSAAFGPPHNYLDTGGYCGSTCPAGNTLSYINVTMKLCILPPEQICTGSETSEAGGVFCYYATTGDQKWVRSFEECPTNWTANNSLYGGNRKFPVPVCTPIATPTASVSVNPTSVAPGGAYTFSFSSVGATNCSLWTTYPDRVQTNPWTWLGLNGNDMGATSGDYEWNALETTDLHIACENAAGWGWGGPVARVTVVPPPVVNIGFEPYGSSGI
jgi:hypothetical protein